MTVSRRGATIAGALLALSMALAACAAAGTPAGTTTASSVPTLTPTASASPTPSAEPEETFAGNIPTSCNSVASADTWEDTVGDLTLQSDGVGFVRPAPAKSTLVLGCDWIKDESSGALLLVSTADPRRVESALETLPERGYECGVTHDFGAEYCSLIEDGADHEEMIVARGDTWVYFSTVNLNGRALLSELAAQIFG